MFKALKKLLQRARILRALNTQLFAEVNMNWYGNASSTCRRIDRVKGKPVASKVFYVDESIRDGFKTGYSFRHYSMASHLDYLKWCFAGNTL